jgi:hypothetical protein
MAAASDDLRKDYENLRALEENINDSLSKLGENGNPMFRFGDVKPWPNTAFFECQFCRENSSHSNVAIPEFMSAYKEDYQARGYRYCKTHENECKEAHRKWYNQQTDKTGLVFPEKRIS